MQEYVKTGKQIEVKYLFDSNIFNKKELPYWIAPLLDTALVNGAAIHLNKFFFPSDIIWIHFHDISASLLQGKNLNSRFGLDLLWGLLLHKNDIY